MLTHRSVHLNERLTGLFISKGFGIGEPAPGFLIIRRRAVTTGIRKAKIKGTLVIALKRALAPLRAGGGDTLWSALALHDLMKSSFKKIVHG